MIGILAGCATHVIGGDEVFSVSAAERGATTALRVELAEGWHLNEEYPSGFQAEGGATTPLAADSERSGHVEVQSSAGVLYVGFCDAERCRIEEVPFVPSSRRR